MADDLIELQKEVHRKIGRNALLFQHVEGLLKLLLADSHTSGYVSDIRTKHLQRQASIHKQTMGQVLRQYLNTQSHLGTSNEPTELKKPWISLTITLKDEQGISPFQSSLNELLAERNELIHHFLSKWNMQSVESGQAAQAYLDQQCDKIVLQAQELENHIHHVQDMKQAIATALRDPYFLQQFLDQQG